MQKIQDESSEINNQINKNKSEREENEQAMFDMLKDIVERIKKELENEKKVRGDAEETIFTLLELTT